MLPGTGSEAVSLQFSQLEVNTVIGSLCLYPRQVAPVLWSCDPTERVLLPGPAGQLASGVGSPRGWTGNGCVPAASRLHGAPAGTERSLASAGVRRRSFEGDVGG